MKGRTMRKSKIIIIGTGFGGLAAAIRLKQAGETDYIILERESDVGGVWRDNTYPGCACDVESHLYSLSFAPNPNWSRKFSKQEEILAYLKDTAKRFGILPHIRFREEVARMDWCEDSAEWIVKTLEGEFRAQFVVAAFGALSDPAIPKLKGLDSFKGQAFHSATWPKDFEPKGKRVAVIGTGASAIQFIPAIQPDVDKIHVFQRTPVWVVPRDDSPIHSAMKTSYRRFKPIQKTARFKYYASRELLVLGLRNPEYMKIVEMQAVKHMKDAIKDSTLLEKVTPDYTIGCKRILLSDDYYPALAQPNVEVITSAIKEVKEYSVVAADGSEREVDTLIFGTGFLVQDPPLAHHIYGGEGRSLADVWAGSPQAYVGTTVAKFPNLFVLQGPNTGIGHSSVLLMMEAQVAHIVKLIRYMKDKNIDMIEPTEQAQQQFVDKMNHSMKGTVWTAGGCDSWYLDKKGRNSTLWPSFTFSFRKLLSKVNVKDYEGRRTRP